MESLGDAKKDSKIAKDMRDKKSKIAGDTKSLLNQVDVTNMGSEGYNLLMKK